MLLYCMLLIYYDGLLSSFGFEFLPESDEIYQWRKLNLPPPNFHGTYQVLQLQLVPNLPFSLSIELPVVPNCTTEAEGSQDLDNCRWCNHEKIEGWGLLREICMIF